MCVRVRARVQLQNDSNCLAKRAQINCEQCKFLCLAVSTYYYIQCFLKEHLTDV